MKPLIPFPQIIKKEYTEQHVLTPKIDINESISIQNMCVKKENIDICSIEQKENIDICPWSPMNHFSKKNEKANVCLQLVNIYAQNSILHQSQNIDPKFLSSMLKLMDKYHVNFNIAVQNDEAKKSSPMDIDEDKLQKKDWNQKKSSYKKNNSIKMWVIEVNRASSTEESKMVKKNLEKCSLSLVISEM